MLLAALALCAAAVAVPSPASAAVLPSGFADDLVATVGAPTALAFTPDGRLLITTQLGLLRVVQGGSLLPTPALDLSSRLCTNSERGLLGVAVDPAFTTNQFVYLFWTFKGTGSCGTGSSTSPVNRVTRHVLPPNNVITAPETLLIDNMQSINGNHNGGDLNFDNNGNLLVSIGDSGVLGESRKNNVLTGKILRIRPDGTIPADNPFQGAGTDRCNITGRIASGTCQETFATGLRNPFRFAFDPNTPGRFYINDVGQNTWEEIDDGQSGADYGYNVREGHCAFGSTTNCGAPPAGMTNPIYDYGRGTGCQAITGGAFVPNGLWGAPWDGKYLFSDFTCGKIFRLDPSGGGFTAADFVTGLSGSSAVHLEFGPFGTSQALYYTTYQDGGQVRRVSKSGTPTASFTATPASGALPLTVNFNGSASQDPNGDALSYQWTFGDGTGATTSVPTTSHVYTTQGTFTASLRVSDPGGLTSAAFTRIIQPGNTAPTPTISSPAAGARFTVGQTLTLTGTATDPQEGTLPATRLSWRVLRHHDNHDHPYFTGTGNNLTITGPAPEDLQAATNSYLLVRLTATDSAGASKTVSRKIMPVKVNLTLATNPTGLQVSVNGTAGTAPYTFTSWQGWKVNISTPTPQGARRFWSWSDFGARTHTITTPSGARTYTARFR